MLFQKALFKEAFATLSVTALALMYSGAVALADTESLKQACYDGDTPAEERITACSGLIETEGFDDLARAYSNRGRAYASSENYEAAISDNVLSLEMRPDHPWTLGNLVSAYIETRQFDLALTNATRLVEVQPDDHWNYYILGKVRHERHEYEQAIELYNRSSELKPDYYFSHYQRGRTRLRLDQHRLADQDFRLAAEIRPFSAVLYYVWGSGMQAGDRTEDAIRALKISDLISPNYRYPRRELDAIIVPPDAAPVLEALPFEPPAAGLSIRYIQQLLPYDSRDDMEKAIDDLIDWFAPVPKAEPKALAFVERTLEPNQGDTVPTAIHVDHDAYYDIEPPPPGSIPGHANTYRGLISTGFQPGGESGPNIRIRFTEGDPGDVWPLEVGKSVVGKGVYELVCPEEGNLPSFIMGCKPGVESIPLGELDFAFLVERAESVLVPMGLYDSYVLRYREQAYLEIFGQRQDREIETRWWISPELNYWVRRTSRDDELFAVIEATERLD